MIVHAYVVRSVALSDPMWSTLPTKREIIFPVGEPPSNDARRWRFTRDDLAAVVAAFSQRTEPAPVYFNHGEDPAKGRKAAGWIDRVELGQDGLYGYIRYTDEARAEIESGAWGYRSPGFEGDTDEEGFTRPRALLEMSLVNEPAIGGMPPVQARAEQSATAPAMPDSPNTEGEHMADNRAPAPEPVKAAKKAAAGFDAAGLLQLVRDSYGMPDAVKDDVLKKLVTDALMGEGDMMEMESEETPIPPVEAPSPMPPPLASASAAPKFVGIETKAPDVDRERVTAALKTAARIGRISKDQLPDAARVAWKDIEAFERLYCAPLPGQIVTASAADRRQTQPITYADTIRAQRNAALGVKGA